MSIKNIVANLVFPGVAIWSAYKAHQLDEKASDIVNLAREGVDINPNTKELAKEYGQHIIGIPLVVFGTLASLPVSWVWTAAYTLLALWVVSNIFLARLLSNGFYYLMDYLIKKALNDIREEKKENEVA